MPQQHAGTMYGEHLLGICLSLWTACRGRFKESIAAPAVAPSVRTVAHPSAQLMTQRGLMVPDTRCAGKHTAIARVARASASLNLSLRRPHILNWIHYSAVTPCIRTVCNHTRSQHKYGGAETALLTLASDPQKPQSAKERVGHLAIAKLCQMMQIRAARSANGSGGGGDGRGDASHGQSPVLRDA